MIICRKIKTDGETESLEAILRYYGIIDIKSENSIIYVIEENDRIIGGSSILLYNDIGVLEYIIIDNNRTGEDLGDGLLRATLNYCYLNGIEKIYYPKDDSYLLKKGFVFNELFMKNEDNSTNNIQSSNKIVCFVHNFFNKGCKGRRVELDV